MYFILQKVKTYYHYLMTLFVECYPWKNPFNPVFLTWIFLRKRISEAKPFFKGITLDVGCGRKPYEDIISQNSRYIGFDYPQFVFNDKGFKRNLKPEVFGDGLNLPFKTESVDCIINTQVMEYISDPDGFIQEMVRVLKNDGTIIMTVPFVYPVHHSSNDFFRYTKSGITLLLKKNGLETVWIKENGGFWITISQLLLHFLNFRIFIRIQHDVLWIIFGLVKLLFLPVILLMNCIVNLFSLFIDSLNHETYLTLNYSLVVKKKKSNCQEHQKCI